MCYPNLPSIQISFSRKEEGGNYYLNILNSSNYPTELLVDAPELPPCGLNPEASRSWVNIYDARDNSHIYGNKVVWLNTDTTSGQSKLVLFDLSNNKTTNVTSGSTNVGSFDMYGDNIVYVNKSSNSALSDFSDITSIIGNVGGDSTGGVPCIYSISKGKVTESIWSAMFIFFLAISLASWYFSMLP